MSSTALESKTVHGWHDEPMTLQFEDFVLDTEQLELRKGGTPVAIEPQAFDLIAHLATHAGRVVDREELIEKVWRGRIVSDAAISTRINAARRALDDDGRSQRMIKTVPRRGFRFVAEVRSAISTAPPKSIDDAIQIHREAQSFAREKIASMGSSS